MTFASKVGNFLEASRSVRVFWGALAGFPKVCPVLTLGLRPGWAARGTPRPNSPKLLWRLLGGLPGKIGVLGGVPGVVLGKLPGNCRGDCRGTAVCLLKARAVSRQSPSSSPGSPSTTPGTPPTTPIFPGSPPSSLRSSFGELGLGVPLAGQPGLNSWGAVGQLPSWPILLHNKFLDHCLL